MDSAHDQALALQEVRQRTALQVSNQAKIQQQLYTLMRVRASYGLYFGYFCVFNRPLLPLFPGNWSISDGEVKHWCTEAAINRCGGTPRSCSGCAGLSECQFGLRPYG